LNKVFFKQFAARAAAMKIGVIVYNVLIIIALKFSCSGQYRRRQTTVALHDFACRLQLSIVPVAPSAQHVIQVGDPWY
jgi:hypothetical protein